MTPKLSPHWHRSSLLQVNSNQGLMFIFNLMEVLKLVQVVLVML